MYIHTPVNCKNLIIFNKQKSLIILRKRSLYLIISLSQQIFLVCDRDVHHKLPGTDHPDSSGSGCLCGDPARVQTPTLRRRRAHTASPVTPLLPLTTPWYRRSAEYQMHVYIVLCKIYLWCKCSVFFCPYHVHINIYIIINYSCQWLSFVIIISEHVNIFN